MRIFAAAAALVAIAACPAPAPPIVAAPKPAAAPALPDIGIRYRVTGSGPALVLVHGNFDSLETWDAVVPALAAKFRVVTLDLPGFGETENKLGGADLATLAGAVARVMDAAGVDRAVIAGNSLGGAVAATFAARFPDRTAGLVLEDANFVDTSPTDAMLGAIGGTFGAAAALDKAPGDAALRAALRTQVAGALRLALHRQSAITDALIDHFTDGFVGHRFAAVRDTNGAMDLTHLAGEVENARADHPFPVLIVWGLDDPLIPVTAAEQVAGWMPGARLVVLGGCGHGPHLEWPDRYVAAVAGAFAAGGALPADDAFVPDPDEQVTVPGVVFEHPRLDRAVRTAFLSALDARGRFVLAVDDLLVDDRDGAAAAVKAIDAAAPGARGYQAFVAGALADLGGAPAIDAYRTALRELPADLRSMAAVRLAQQALPADVAAELDAAIAPPPTPGAGEPMMQVVARIDRALIADRYADALAGIARIEGEPLFVETRRAWALLGLGRLAAANDAIGKARDIWTTPRPTARRTAIGAWVECAEMLQRRIDVARVGLSYEDARCAPPADGAQLFAAVPPPPLARIVPLGLAAGTPVMRGATIDKQRDARANARAALAPFAATPSGAAALAELALEEGDFPAARAAFASVPAGADAQAPEAARHRLAIRAAAKDGKAIAEAHALAAAHAGDAAWLHVEASTLLAAGRFDDALAALARVVALDPEDDTREELALALVGRARLDDARAIDAAVRDGGRPRTTWFDQLPTIAPLAAKLTAPPTRR